MQASVEHPAEGYAAALGWIQIVSHGPLEQETTIVDVPPQISEAGIP